MMVDGHGHGLFLVMGNLGCHGNKVFVPGERSMDGLGMWAFFSMWALFLDASNLDFSDVE